MKYLIPVLALIAGLVACEPAQAIGRRAVVSKQVVVQRNVVQRVRVQRVVVAQPVVAVQAFHAPVQAFVAPTYGVQAFSAGHCQQQIVAPVVSNHCGAFFSAH